MDSVWYSRWNDGFPHFPQHIGKRKELRESTAGLTGVASPLFASSAALGQDGHQADSSRAPSIARRAGAPQRAGGRFTIAQASGAGAGFSHDPILPRDPR